VRSCIDPLHHRIFANLEALFSTQERISIAAKFLDSLREHSTTRLNVEKLLLMGFIISDSLFQSEGALSFYGHLGREERRGEERRGEERRGEERRGEERKGHCRFSADIVRNLHPDARKAIMPMVLSNLKRFFGCPGKMDEKRECISLLLFLLEELQTNLAVFCLRLPGAGCVLCSLIDRLHPATPHHIADGDKRVGFRSFFSPARAAVVHRIPEVRADRQEHRQAHVS